MSYLKEKLSDILLAIQVHPENANVRLCESTHANIMWLRNHAAIPKEYLEKFNKLAEIMENEQNMDGRLHKIPYMHKETAAKYIKLLMDIYYRI